MLNRVLDDPTLFGCQADPVSARGEERERTRERESAREREQVTQSKRLGLLLIEIAL